MRGIPEVGPLPSSRLRVAAGAAGAAGELLASWDYGTERCPVGRYRGLPPPISEIPDAELAAFRAATAPEEHGASPPPAPGARALLAERPAAADGAPGETWDPPGREPTAPRLYVLAFALSLAAASAAAVVGYAAWLGRDQRETT